MRSKTCPLVRVLATALLVGGCYSGLDEESAGIPTPTGSETSAGSRATTGDAETSAAEGTGETTTGDPSGTTGALDPTTGEGTTTGAPATTTGGVSGDGTTGAGSDGQTTGGSTDGTTGEPPPPDMDVPDGVPYCEAAKNWPAEWRQLEEDVLVIVNQKRAQGASCGSEGNFGPAGPLTMHPALRCAARMHSKDMADRNFFSHTNPDNESPWDRMAKAGYGAYSNAGENIAAGSPTAAGTMDQWMNSDGHCANIMNPAFEHIGVGYYPGGQYGHLWTQVFGAK